MKVNLSFFHTNVIFLFTISSKINTSRCAYFRIFPSLGFYVKSILENENGFTISGALNFDLVDFSLQKVQKFINNQIPDFKLSNLRQLWFPVKSEWQKKSAISTLCMFIPTAYDLFDRRNSCLFYNFRQKVENNQSDLISRESIWSRRGQHRQCWK